MERGHHGGGLGGQRRAVQRHHPVPGRRPAGDHGGRAGRHGRRVGRRRRDDRLQQRRAHLAGRLGQARPGHLGPVGGEPGRARLDDLQQLPLGPGRHGKLRRLGHLVQRRHHQRGGGAGAGRQSRSHPEPGEGPPARQHQPRPGRQPLRRRPRGAQRLRRGHLGPDGLQPVGRRPASPRLARGHRSRCRPAASRRHLERRACGRGSASDQPPVRRPDLERRGLERRRTGTAGPGPAGPGTTWAWNGAAGTAQPGPARPGTTRGLERLGLERRGLDGPPGTAQLERDQPGGEPGHEATAADPGIRRGFRRGRRGHPGPRRMAAAGLGPGQRGPVDRRGRDGRPRPGQLGVAGRGVPGRRVRGLQHGRGLLRDPRPARAAAGHPGDPGPGDRPGPGGPQALRSSSRRSTPARCSSRRAWDWP